jgi:hypothetical protein
MDVRDERGAYRVPVGNPEKERPLERSISRLESNIKMNFNKMDFF